MNELDVVQTSVSGYIEAINKPISPEEHNFFTQERIPLLEKNMTLNALECGFIFERYRVTKEYKKHSPTFRSFCAEYSKFDYSTIYKFMQFARFFMQELIELPLGVVLHSSYPKVLLVRKQIEQADTVDKKMDIMNDVISLSRSDLQEKHNVKERPCPDCGEQLSRVFSWECKSCGWGGKGDENE